jgi:hypothetical protein
MMFRKLDLFPFSGKGGRKQIQFPKRRIFYFLEQRTMEEVQNPVILCVMHHRQKTLEAISLKEFTFLFSNTKRPHS